MAQVTNTFETYDAKGLKEEVSNTIHLIEPDETPFMKLAGRSSISTVHPEWQLDTYKSIDTSNNQPEGNQWQYDAVTATTRVGNYAQISDVKFTISGSLEAHAKYGRGSEKSYQKAKKAKELKMDMEAILLSNQASSAGSGDGATNRTTGGLRAWIATNDDMNSGTSGGYNTSTNVVDAAVNGTQRAFSKTILDSVILNTYNSGGEVGRSTLLVSPYVKQVFSGFMDGNDVALSRKEFSTNGQNAIIASADLYKSDFGLIPVVPNRQMKRAGAGVARNAFLVDPEKVSVGFFRDFMIETPAKTGDSENCVILAEYSLIVMNEAGLGCAADLYGLTASS